jgi:hypothetical protein
MLLHDGKSEDNVRSFFTEVHELYLKVTRTHRMHTKLAKVWTCRNIGMRRKAEGVRENKQEEEEEEEEEVLRDLHARSR